MSHLLVTNDFPPKVGGIQSYLHELWRRLPPEEVTVLTTARAGAAEFDAGAGFRIVRSRDKVLLPVPRTIAMVRSLLEQTRAGLVVLDPALPLGLIGPNLAVPYAIVVHGAEVALPARLPGVRRLLGRVLADARLVVSAGSYPASEAVRALRDGPARPSRLGLPPVIVPPGVDPVRFRPLGEVERREARGRLGLSDQAVVVLGASRLVPRKGMDVLIEAVARLGATRSDLELLVSGDGRDRGRLERIAARSDVAVRFLGRVPDEELALVYASADVFAMCCRNRWFGLEQEGFGIVFLEAAACGVPQVAGRSGGADEAVVDGKTGYVVPRPGDPAAVASALARLIDDPQLRSRLGAASRARVLEVGDYDLLARRLHRALLDAGG